MRKAQCYVNHSVDLTIPTTRSVSTVSFRKSLLTRSCGVAWVSGKLADERILKRPGRGG